MMDFKTIGTSYTVLDYDDGRIKEMFVVDSDDLYELTNDLLGREHLEGAVRHRWSRIHPTVKHPWDITWYTATQDEFSLEAALVAAKHQGNHVVVVEILPED